MTMKSTSKSTSVKRGFLREEFTLARIGLGGVCIYLIHAMAQARSTKALKKLMVFSQRRAMRRKRLI